MSGTARFSIAVIAILALVGIGWWLVARGDTTLTNNNEQMATEEQDQSKVGVQDVTVGDGQAAAVGDTIVVRYVGVLEDGTVFDTTEIEGREPFTTTLGAGQVIPGWEAGILGMREGGVRLLSIPPEFAYGAEGVGTIPPNATLIFQVELVSVVKAGAPDGAETDTSVEGGAGAQ
jgi:FKBP-type peptidyl-prolyl cis-trans isomerase